MKPETLRRYFGDMPPVDHYPKRDQGVPFCWQDSELVRYLTKHDLFMNNVMERLRESGAIVFDPESKTWAGYRYSGKVKIPCCQNSLSKGDDFLQQPLSKTPSPYYTYGDGGICDSRRSPDPFVTAKVTFDSNPKSGKEVCDEPW